VTLTPTITRTPTITPTPTATPRGYVSTPNGLVSDWSRSRLYISSRNANVVLVRDEVTENTLAVIPVGSRPWGMGMVNDRVFVSNYNSASVAVIDAATLSKMTTIDVSSCGGGPGNIAVNPDTNRVYVALTGSGRVAAINATNNTLIDCIATADGVFGIAVNTYTNHLYVSNRVGMNLQAFDVSTVPATKVGADVPLGGVPLSVRWNQFTWELYVMVAFDAPNYATADTLQVYSTSASGIAPSPFSQTIIGNTEDGGMIWVSQATGILYVAATAINELRIVDPVSFLVCNTIPMTDPYALAEDPARNEIYVANRSANKTTTVSNQLMCLTSPRLQPQKR
jgi:YVTN family beta-propeller protein